MTADIAGVRSFFERCKPKRIGILELIDILEHVGERGRYRIDDSLASQLARVEEFVEKLDDTEWLSVWKKKRRASVPRKGSDVMILVEWLGELAKVFSQMPPRAQYEISSALRTITATMKVTSTSETWFADYSGYYMLPSGTHLLITEAEKARFRVSEREFFERVHGDVVPLTAVKLFRMIGTSFDLPESDT